MKRIIFVLAVTGLMVFAGCGLFPASDQKAEVKGPAAVINTSKGSNTIAVEIADTSAERAQGLMNRKSLEANSGMFFIFEDEKKVRFWMKNTLIPLDMIFMDSSYNVVGIQKDAPPCKKDPCATFGPEKNVKYVLEVVGGTSDKLDIKEGDKVQLKI